MKFIFPLISLLFVLPLMSQTTVDDAEEENAELEYVLPEDEGDIISEEDAAELEQEVQTPAAAAAAECVCPEPEQQTAEFDQPRFAMPGATIIISPAPVTPPAMEATPQQQEEPVRLYYEQYESGNYQYKSLGPEIK